MLRIILLCLLLAGPVLAGKPKPGGDGVTWTKVGTVQGVSGNYTPLYVNSDGSIAVYSNTDGAVDGQWYRRFGSWSSVGTAGVAIASAAILDEGPAFYRVRSSAVQRNPATGECVGMVMTGNGYPTTDGYRPAWATSADCISWTYHGHFCFVVDGCGPYVQTDSAAMIAQWDKSSVVDDTNPANNRFLAFLNYYAFPAYSANVIKLAVAYSGDGVTWTFARDGNGNVIEYWPAGVSGPAFPTAAVTPYGFHVAAENDGWTGIVHIFSCPGSLNFHAIETASEVRGTAAKGTNFTYEPATNMLHALTAGTHWKIAAKNFGC